MFIVLCVDTSLPARYVPVTGGSQYGKPNVIESLLASQIVYKAHMPTRWDHEEFWIEY
jgi:hypothetical protein